MFFADEGQITVNDGAPATGREALAEMAAGFFAEFPGLTARCDEPRVSGDHVLFAWALEGTRAVTKNRVCVRGWEEWDRSHREIRRSSGWFDANEYERQIRERV